MSGDGRLGIWKLVYQSAAIATTFTILSTTFLPTGAFPLLHQNPKYGHPRRIGECLGKCRYLVILIRH